MAKLDDSDIIDVTPEKTSASKPVMAKLDDSDIVDVTPAKPPVRAPVESPQKSELERLSMKELLEQKNKVMSLMAYTDNLPDKGARILKKFNALDDELERRKELGLDRDDETQDIVILDDDEPRRVQPKLPSGSVMTKNGLLPPKHLIDALPPQQDLNAMVSKTNKKLMGGKMTDQKFRQVNLISDRVVQQLAE